LDSGLTFLAASPQDDGSQKLYEVKHAQAACFIGNLLARGVRVGPNPYKFFVPRQEAFHLVK
jgi:hypothetical protein